jgi:hypothetical protein
MEAGEVAAAASAFFFIAFFLAVVLESAAWPAGCRAGRARAGASARIKSSAASSAR